MCIRDRTRGLAAMLLNPTPGDAMARECSSPAGIRGGGCGPLLWLQRVTNKFGFCDFVRVQNPAQCWRSWGLPTSLFLSMLYKRSLSPLISASSAWSKRSRQEWLCLREDEVTVLWFLLLLVRMSPRGFSQPRDNLNYNFQKFSSLNQR